MPRGALDGVVRDVHLVVDRPLEPVGEDLLDRLAVGQDLHQAFDRVGHLVVQARRRGVPGVVAVADEDPVVGDAGGGRACRHR